MTPSLIDIVLPVYNEEQGIAIFHEALSAVLETLVPKYHFNIIYVLDRSGDDSLGALKRIAASDARVTVLHLSRRFGHQMSLIAGLDHSSGDAEGACCRTHAQRQSAVGDAAQTILRHA